MKKILAVMIFIFLSGCGNELYIPGHGNIKLQHDCSYDDKICNWNHYKSLTNTNKIWGEIVLGTYKGNVMWASSPKSIHDAYDMFFRHPSCKDGCKVTHIGITEIDEKKQRDIVKKYTPPGSVDKIFSKPKKIVKKKKKPKKTKPKESESDKLYAVASGTGFFINNSGNIISNNHVIDSCGTVKIHYNGISKPATILATDYINDLSLMRSEVIPNDYFSVSSTDASLLDEIYVAGYPFGKAISSSVKVTKGVVSALTGLGNNYSNIQIDAALQPGNSGGPIINKKGNVVGVAVAKLDYKAVIEDFGAIPEGTNFGIKSSTVQQFIKANNVTSETGGYREMSTQDIGKKIEKATVYLDCWMTAQQIKEYKTKKTFFTNIE